MERDDEGGFAQLRLAGHPAQRQQRADQERGEQDVAEGGLHGGEETATPAPSQASTMSHKSGKIRPSGDLRAAADQDSRA